ncbi:MAG: peptide deformylase [Candidatus Obscuribacterales bacterium]|nr:peptide deformylase [Cyanobacteria bacterium SZAS LIN-5]RTL44123.1 MAG: peptide deformylase [Candidatus Melainabacteria bacterium]
MSKLQLRYFPDEVLKTPAKKISSFDASTRKLAQDMLDTMYENDGVGLAAPQVGVSKRLMVIDVAGEDEKRKPIVFINPVIVHKEGELVGLEGCLSFPGVYFEVKRANKIVVRYQNVQGRDQKLEAEGDLLCRAIQHEIDHLDGELFINKAVNNLVRDLEMTKHGFADGDIEKLQDKIAASSGHIISTKQSQQQPVVG